MKTSLILNDHKDSELEREVEFSHHIVTVVMFRQHLTLKEIFTIKTLPYFIYSKKVLLA